MFKKLFKPTLLVFAMSSASVYAADAINLNITGRVTAEPCNVNGGAAGLDIDLGNNIGASTLADAGDSSPFVTKDLVLTECPPGTTKVKVTFNGTPDTTSPTMYTNIGTATPLAVELRDGNTDSVLSNGGSITQDVLVNGADRTVTYKLKARAFTAAGSVAPGTINSVVEADFTYQ